MTKDAYLFRRDGAAVHLSLNQGTTAVLREAGRSRYREVLADQAARDAGLIAAEDLSELDTGPIDLDGQTDLSRGYEAGNICSRTYLSGALPSEDELQDDLTRFLVLYSALVSARGSLEAESRGSGSSAEAFLEAQRYSWHRRAERNNTLATGAKRIHGTQCQVCEIVLSDVYGDIAEGYIEAHHLTPFASLSGRPTALDPTSDFAVVCPNCHRMLHRGPPYTLAELRGFMTS
jgi:5-methylcytosine-specific restriction protein A